MRRIVVVGAGISGLSAAYHLTRRRPDVEVMVLESSSRLGGCIRSESIDGYLVEHGPNGFLDNNPSTIELAREIGLGERLTAASEGSRKHRFLFINNRVEELPGGLRAFATSPLLPLTGKLRLLAEPIIRPGRGGPESVADFARRRLGRAAADVFIDALVTGIHGGDPEYLDVRAAFPRMSGFEREAGSVVRGMIRAGRAKKKAARARGERPLPQRMWSLPGGLGELIDTLAGRLPVTPRSGCPVNRIGREAGQWVVDVPGDRITAEAIVLACPPSVQAELLRPLDSSLADELASIASNRIAVVALGYREVDVPRRYDGFGFIAPQNTGQDVLGVQWCSAIFLGRAPAGMVLYRALCGGWRRRDIVDWPDDRLVDAVGAVLRQAQGIEARPAFARVIRWSPAIPQYAVGHPERVARIDAAARRLPGLHLIGNGLRGIAINDCTTAGREVAGRLADSLPAT